jgi:hypothetical protein
MLVFCNSNNLWFWSLFGLIICINIKILVYNSVGVTKLSGVQTLLPITSPQVSEPHRKSRKLHRNLVQNYLDEASVMVIVNTMPILVALASLLTYSCSAPIMIPWVQQWRSDAFSPVLECQLILQKNRQILLTGCLHNTTQNHHTKTTSTSLLHINLPKKHVRRKPQPIYHLTMPIKHTVFVRCPNTKRGSISKGDGSDLTLNDKGEVILAPGPLPASSSGSTDQSRMTDQVSSGNGQHQHWAASDEHQGKWLVREVAGSRGAAGGQQGGDVD